MHSINMLYTAILAGVPAALATPIAPGANNEPGNHYCAIKENSEYKDVKSGEPYAQWPVRASGYECTSPLKTSCTVTKSASHTEGVIETVGGSAGGALDLTKILGLSLAANYGYSWTTSDTTGTSASITCPAGNLHCGILVTTFVVKTTGKTRNTYVNRAGNKCQEPDDWVDFEVVAPYESAPNAPENQRVKMDFSTCLDASQCTGDVCETKEAKALTHCDTSIFDFIGKGPWINVT